MEAYEADENDELGVKMADFGRMRCGNSRGLIFKSSNLSSLRYLCVTREDKRGRIQGGLKHVMNISGVASFRTH